MVRVKICGIMTPEALTAAITAGADFVGFVFVPESRHYLDPESAAYLAHYVPDTLKRVGLFQNAAPADVLNTVRTARMDMIQLHGDEPPEEVAHIRAASGLPVIKVIAMRGPDDLARIALYEEVADWLLFDAARGGSGKRFDWSLLQNHLQQAPLNKPWMLAGGLTPDNVAEALAAFTPNALDVSSGVESEKTVKDPAKIRAFIAAARKI